MKHFLWILLAVSFNALALSVPFSDVILTPSQQINVDYSFAPHNAIFCWDATFAPIGIVTWPYNGAINNAPLPITLTANDLYQGNRADPSGVITIQNNTSQNMLVTCDFAF